MSSQWDGHCDLGLLKFMSERVKIKAERTEETHEVIGIDWATGELIVSCGALFKRFLPSELELIPEDDTDDEKG